MSRDNARRYLVAYDIPSDQRRARIAKMLGSYGDRVQYSVFVVDVKPARLVRLRSDLRGLLCAEEDSILLCSLGPVADADDGRFEFLGRRRDLTDNTALIY
jgi:CRISPR-associated protein Cas2